MEQAPDAQPLLLTSPPTGEACDVLSSLRASIGLARALGSALHLPDWSQPNDGPLPCDALVDADALRNLVPIMSTSQAQCHVAALTAMQVHVVDVVSEGCGSNPCCDELLIAGLKFPERLIAAAQRSHVTVRTPLRTRKEVLALLNPQGRFRLIVLPTLPGSLLSASATTLAAHQRCSVGRALATPPLSLQQSALALARTGRMHPNTGTASLCSPAPAAGDALAPLRPFLVDAEAHRGSGRGCHLAIVVDGPSSIEQGAQEWARTAAAAAIALLKAHPPPQDAQTCAGTAPDDATTVVLVMERALVAGSMATAPERAAVDAIVERLQVKGWRSARTLLTPDERGRCHAKESEAGRPQLAFACRWLCATAPLLLLPPIQAAPLSLIVARQSLGKLVDHAYLPNGPGQLPADVHVLSATAKPPEPSRTNSVPPETPPTSNTLPHGDDCEATACNSIMANHGQAAAAVTPNEVLSTGSADGGASRGDALLALMASKLAPELRGRVLGYHEFAPPGSSAMEAAPCDVATAHPPASAAAKPPCMAPVAPVPHTPTASQRYDAFMERTRPLLCSLPFAPSPLEGATHVAVIIEPRASPEIIARVQYVIRNVAVMLADASREGTTHHRWALQLFHGTTNSSLIAAGFTDTEWARIGCVSLGVDNLRSSDEYSSLLTSHWFWERVGAEHVLIFQEDALLCGPSIERFAATLDYVGAPWEPWDRWVRGKAWLCAVGGNGGLSLRKRSQAIACLDAVSRQLNQWEDAYFVETLQQLGHAVANAEQARGFAVERRGRLHERPAGLHKAYAYLTEGELGRILDRVEDAYRERARRAAVAVPRDGCVDRSLT